MSTHEFAHLFDGVFGTKKLHKLYIFFFGPRLIGIWIILAHCIEAISPGRASRFCRLWRVFLPLLLFLLPKLDCLTVSVVCISTPLAKLAIEATSQWTSTKRHAV